MQPNVVIADSSNFRETHSIRWGWLLAYLSVTALSWVIRSGIYTNFMMFLLSDSGTNLHTDEMVARGLIPTIDFTYFYGPLSILIPRIPFAIGGQTPLVYFAFQMVCGLLVAINLWRISEIGNWGTIPRLWMLMVLFLIVMPFQAMLLQPLELVLLVQSLTEQYRGRRDRALVWAGLAAMVKPTQGYVVFLVILIWELIDFKRGIRTRRQTLQTLAFPLVAAITAMTGVILIFGMRAVWNMQVPLIPTAFYRDEGFGFFGRIGRQGWDPTMNTFHSYLSSPIGLWLLTTMIVGGAALWLVIQRPQHPRSIDREFLITLGVLSLVGMFVLYGHPPTWKYFSYLPFIGIGMLLHQFRVWPWLQVRALILLAVPAMITLILQVNLGITKIQAWTAIPESPGLGDSSFYVDTWKDLLQQNPEPFLLMESFSPAMVQHRCICADCWSFTTARIFTPREQQSLRDFSQGRRICFSSINPPEVMEQILNQPWMQEILVDRQVIWKSDVFTLYGLPGEAVPK